MSYVKPSVPIEDRFMKHVVKQDDGCWIWQSELTDSGYGRATILGNRTVAHRMSFELFVGPIPDGLELDHLCEVRRCVNPTHLEPTTRKENLRRSTTPGAVAARTGRCKRGHRLTPENVYTYRGSRHCKQCIAIRAGRGA